jgi:hypothetical protein
MADHLDLIADIESGHYDEHIIDVLAALRARAAAAGVGSRWRITIDGETWDEDTLTAGEIRMVAKTLGVDWPPDPIDSADAIVLWVIAHYHKVLGMDLKEAWDRAEALNGKQLIAAVTEYQVAGTAPKDQPASMT